MEFEHRAETYWTESRLELRAWFRRNAASLGELYEGALRMVFDQRFPGRTRFVAHAVREIRNRLPDVITNTKTGGTFPWKNKLDDLTKEWKNAGFTLDGSMPANITVGQTTPSPNVPITPRLFQRIISLLSDHLAAREKPEDSAIRLFVGITPGNQILRDALRPIVFHWLDVTEWFVKRVHDSGAQDISIDEADFVYRFELFEMTLGALVRAFFRTVDGLDEILEDANS